MTGTNGAALAPQDQPSPEGADNEPISEASVALVRVVNEEYAKWAMLQPDGVRVMEVARILCQKRGCENPNLVIMGDPGQEPVKGPKGTIALFAPLQPAWFLYWSDAIEALEVVQEADPTESEETDNARVSSERPSEG